MNIGLRCFDLRGVAGGQIVSCFIVKVQHTEDQEDVMGFGYGYK